MRVEVNKFDTLTKAINAPLLLGDLVMIVTDDIYQYGVIDYYKPLDEWNHPTASGLAIRWLRASDVVETEKNWTVDYNKNGYVKLPSPVSITSSTVELTFTTSGIGGSRYASVIGLEGDPTTELFISTGNILKWKCSGTVTIDGETITKNSDISKYLDDLPHVLVYSTGADATSIDLIGNGWQKTTPWEGTLTNIKLPNRFYKSLYPTKPTDLVLIDEISGENGTLTNFPAGSEWIEIDTPSPPPIHLFNN